MQTPDASPGLFLAGVVLIYAAGILIFSLVLKTNRVIPMSRRRPEASDATSNLAMLTESAVGIINRQLRNGAISPINRDKLERAGLKLQPADFLLMMGAGALLGAVAGFFIGGPFGAVLLFLGLPTAMFVYVIILTSRRQAKFDEQLPDTLQMLTGSMRAGHSLLRAIDASAKETDAPMSEELSRIVNETRIGRDLGDSMEDVAHRTASDDFKWISQAIEIHREVGGDLAEVLDHVGETIRDRNQIRRQVKALSAEGKMSAIVLIGLPIVLFFALVFVNPKYANTFTSTVPGYLMLIVSGVMLSIGAFWMSRLIKAKY